MNHDSGSFKQSLSIPQLLNYEFINKVVKPPIIYRISTKINIRELITHQPFLSILDLVAPNLLTRETLKVRQIVFSQ